MPLIIFSNVGIGSPILACHNNFYFPFVYTCCFDSSVVRTWGGSEGSPLWLNTILSFRCVRKKGGDCLLLSLFLGGVKDGFI